MSDLCKRLRADADLHAAWDKYELGGKAPEAMVEGVTAALERESATTIESLQARIAELERRIDIVRALTLDCVSKKAREFAAHYPEASDGRNTFILFAEYAEAMSPTLNIDSLVEMGAEAAHAEMYKNDVGCNGGVCKFARGCGCSGYIARAVLTTVLGREK